MDKDIENMKREEAIQEAIRLHRLMHPNATDNESPDQLRDKKETPSNELSEKLAQLAELEEEKKRLRAYKEFM